MGRKGKKKGEQGGESGSAQGQQQAAPPQRQEQARPQQQQASQGQAGRPQQQGQQPRPQAGQQGPQGQAGPPPGPTQQQQGQQPPVAWVRPRQQTPQQQPQQQQQGPASQPRPQAPQQQPQQPQPSAWGPPRQQQQPAAQATSGLASQMQRVSTQDQSRGRGQGRGMGRDDGRPQQGRQEQRPGPPQEAQQPRRIPGMTGDARPQQGRQGQRQGPPQQAQQQQRIPGMTGDGRQQQGRQEQPSRPPSTASSVGDAASVKSGGSGPQQKPSTKAPTPGGLDKKALTEDQKNRYMNMIPVRRNVNKAGTAGRPIEVFTNMISIIFNSNFKISATHYDVKFDPDKPKFLKKLAFHAVREQHFPNNWPAFDGRVNAYSAGDLPFGSNLATTITVFDPERQQNREVKVSMDKVNIIDMSWLKKVRPGIQETERDQTTIQVLDIILRSAPYSRAITVGRSFFQQPRPAGFDLSGGMELWVGMFQSAVLGWKPYFNVDVAHKAFPKAIPVIEVLKDLLADRRGNKPRDVDAGAINNNWDLIQKFLKGLKVIYQLPNTPSSKRTVGVNGLSRPASEAVFTLDNGEETTVQRYFAGAKRYNIRRHDLPTLWIGSRTKNILVPMELCQISPGLVLNGKLNEEQTRRMIRETAKDTITRKNRILDSYTQMNYNEHPTMKEFGISLSGQFEKVNARVLDPPSLQYQMKVERPFKGVWRASQFLTAQKIPDNSWAILNLSRVHENDLRTFVDMLTRFGSQNGMNIGKPQTPFQLMRPPSRDIRELHGYLQTKKREGIKLLIVVIPGFGADVYPKVKQQAELQVGILTQCVKDNTVNKMVDRQDASTAGNILLKINSKLNGINHTFEAKNRPNCLKPPVIIFGADVTHPSPDAIDIPSIAAVAASHSEDVFKYNVDIRLQPARQEIILQLEEIVYKQLKAYQKNTGKKPEKIFFYRDGVSEGQFAQVMFYELQAIKNGCRKFGGAVKYEPKITFLVVQKRHHIRLFPANPKNSDDRNGNVQAGTIVDTQITHPSHIDFYLVSHASIQGTARPTKYRCLCDENDMTEDEIEQLTYYLCHMFSRCTRSVSYPAPTYYAHLAAFRARALTYGVNIQMNNLERAQLTNLTLHGDLINNNPMFFV